MAASIHASLTCAGHKRERAPAVDTLWGQGTVRGTSSAGFLGLILK